MPEQKPEIQYDDFAKLDIRIGTIVAAEMVPETDKLIKCTVDFGELGTRTIVSGIALYRTPESLVGKQLPYLINLKPKMLKGVESAGMLLAVGDGDVFSLVTPEGVMPPGCRIK